MNTIHHLPLRPDEMLQLQTIMARADLIVPGNYVMRGPHRIIDYLSAAEFRSVEFRALFDRNLISPLVALAGKKNLAAEPAQMEICRLACASMAFCILANITVEPSMALYEYASGSGHEAAESDLRLFRIIDNADPRALLDIALGVTARLPEDHLDDLERDPEILASPVREKNFAKELTLWRPNYLHVLKAVSLLRSSRTPLDAVLDLLRWQSEESYFNAAAATYLMAAMSHHPPKGKMLKSARSEKSVEIIKGVRNATWDICFIQQFKKFITDPEEPNWSLWSHDIALRAIARDAFLREDESAEDKIKISLQRGWGKSASTIFKAYVRYSQAAQVDPAARDRHTSMAFARLDSDIAALEGQLTDQLTFPRTSPTGLAGHAASRDDEA